MKGLDAVAHLKDALTSLGVVVRDQSLDDRIRGDLVVVLGDGRQLQVEVKRLSTVATENVTRLSEEGGTSGEEPDIWFLVADRITADARSRLTELGWGWMDLRGHLYLSLPGIALNTEIDSLWTRPERSDPLAGKAGLEVACLLLSIPGEAHSIRAMARELDRSPSTVSDIMRSLRDNGIVDEEGEIEYRQLFWLVADKWPNRRLRLATSPDPGGLKRGSGSLDQALGLGIVDADDSIGWALTDTLAAVAYGVPLAVRAGHPPDFFVPTTTTLRRARTLLSVAPEGTEAEATVRLAPVPDVCAHRVDLSKRSDEHWPVAAPLFVALDLAQDPGRGREVLDNWDPTSQLVDSEGSFQRGWARVW